MKMTETLLTTLRDIASHEMLNGGYPANWKTASRKKLMAMGLVHEVSLGRYTTTAVGQRVLSDSYVSMDNYFFARQDGYVFEYAINTIGRGKHVVELRGVNNDRASNHSDPYWTIREAVEAMSKDTPFLSRYPGLGWCVGDDFVSNLVG